MSNSLLKRHSVGNFEVSVGDYLLKKTDDDVIGPDTKLYRVDKIQKPFILSSKGWVSIKEVGHWMESTENVGFESVNREYKLAKKQEVINYFLFSDK
jgi:hypothetical protein